MLFEYSKAGWIRVIYCDCSVAGWVGGVTVCCPIASDTGMCPAETSELFTLGPSGSALFTDFMCAALNSQATSEGHTHSQEVIQAQDCSDIQLC